MQHRGGIAPKQSTHLGAQPFPDAPYGGVAGFDQREFAVVAADVEPEKVTSLVEVDAGRVARAPRKLLDPLLASEVVWDRRIAVLATYALIKRGSFDQTVRVCEALLGDTHNLIHKATGWMLREVGKRDERVLRDFLDRHAGRMPRTMLRYSLERLPDEDRVRYMAAGRR